MANIVTIPISNVLMGSDYTGQISVGPESKPMNVILDTGSSALALDAAKYQPQVADGDLTTDLAQTDSYGDGSSWTGAVIKTQISAGSGTDSVVLQGGNASIAYATSGEDMFESTDGILGLAYAPLDDAFTMPKNTWQNKYSAVQVRAGKQGTIEPYLTQLAAAGVTSDIISFVTRRSFAHVGGGGANDPLNQGLMIIGGGDVTGKLHTGNFQTVKVVSDQWYCTNLKSITVGTADPIVARIDGPKGMPSNSIIDSGTNSLNLSSQMLKAILSKFTPAQQDLLNKSILDGKLVSSAQLQLADWPTLTFVLEGTAGDVSLDVPPSNYWQVNTQKVGAAMAAITVGQAGLAILGLPIMNGNFTIFDGEANNGLGVVQFAPLAN
jgi:hypothetical protein